MTTWRKLAFGSTAAISVLGGCVAWLDHRFADLCASTVIERVASPSGILQAVVFQIDCGAASDFNSQVAIVSGDQAVSGKAALPKSFFVADRDHGKAPEGKEHGPELRLTWLSDRHVEIRHHELARVIRAEKPSHGVVVDYITFR